VPRAGRAHEGVPRGRVLDREREVDGQALGLAGVGAGGAELVLGLRAVVQAALLDEAVDDDDVAEVRAVEVVLQLLGGRGLPAARVVVNLGELEEQRLVGRGVDVPAVAHEARRELGVRVGAGVRGGADGRHVEGCVCW